MKITFVSFLACIMVSACGSNGAEDRARDGSNSDGERAGDSDEAGDDDGDDGDEVNVGCGGVLTYGATTGATVGAFLSITPTSVPACDNPTGLVWTAELPSGLAIDPSSATIEGVPLEAGSFAIRVVLRGPGGEERYAAVLALAIGSASSFGLSLSGFEPSTGATGLTVVTLHGVGFELGALVRVQFASAHGWLDSTQVERFSDTMVTAVVPIGALTGQLQIRVGDFRSVVSADTFTVRQAPEIHGVVSWTNAVGGKVVVLGAGFAADPVTNIAKINGTSSPVSAGTASDYLVVTPVAPAGETSVISVANPETGTAVAGLGRVAQTPANISSSNAPSGTGTWLAQWTDRPAGTASTSSNLSYGFSEGSLDCYDTEICGRFAMVTALDERGLGDYSLTGFTGTGPVSFSYAGDTTGSSWRCEVYLDGARVAVWANGAVTEHSASPEWSIDAGVHTFAFVMRRVGTTTTGSEWCTIDRLKIP